MKTPNRRSVLAGIVGLTAAAPLRAFAQNYPERPITLVVPFAAGGSTDILARVVAGHLHPALGQPVIIENRTGASGNIGTATVARAVPYGGGAPAVADRVGGQTQLFFTAGTQSLEHVKAGKLRLLAVTEGKRSALLPDIPTVAETLPGYEMAVWYGAFGPAGMPKDVVAKLNREINRILFLPDVKNRMDEIPVDVPKPTPPDSATMPPPNAEN